VPAALADVVLGFRGLDDFRPRPHSRIRGYTPSPHADSPYYSLQNGSSWVHFLVPEDFATIYDVSGIYSQGVDGTGAALAIVGQTDYTASDISDFRTLSGLPAIQITDVLVPGTGSSFISANDLGEAELDLEWSGAVAKNAAIKYVYTGNGQSSGAVDALIYAVDNAEAPVISISYGGCEPQQPPSQATDQENVARQANAQGITIVASSGDSGAAGCESGSATVASHGLAIEMPSSVPEITAMGGTELDEGSGTYWSNNNDANDGSALSYIPEMGWNDSSGNPLSASGGGVSIYFSKPSWQSVTGVPAGSFRYAPDLALNSSPQHDGYLVCVSGSCSSSTWAAQHGMFQLAGGTSVAAPTFAGILTLINDALGSGGLGNVNPTLYGLPASANAIHDVTAGNNIVPCQSGTTGCPSSPPLQYGYSAGAGYDPVTGLGSVDAAKLLTALGIPTTTSLHASATTVAAGAQLTLTATVTAKRAGPALSGSVAFFANGSAIGSVSVTDGAPSSGDQTATAVLDISTLPAGMDSLTAQYSGDASNTGSTSAAVSVDVTGTFNIMPPAPTVAPRGAIAFTAAGGVMPITWSLSSSGSHGSINMMTGAYTAGATPNTTDVVVATDSASPAHAVSATVSVGPGVSLSAPPASVPPRGTVSFTASGGSSSYTWTVPTAPSGGSINSSGVYKAGTTANVTDTVKVTDSLGNSATQNVHVGAGVSINAPATTAVPRGSITLTASGGSGTGYLWTIPTHPSGGSVNSSGVYTAGAAGSVTDTVNVADSLGNSASVQISVGPVITISASATTVMTGTALTLTASGGSGTGFRWAMSSSPSGGTVTAGGIYTAGHTAHVTDVVQVTDSLSNTASIMIQVIPALAISASSPTVPPLGGLALSTTGGVSGVTYTWSIPTNASGGSITNQGAYTAGHTGSVMDTVRVADSQGHSATLTISVTAGVSISGVPSSEPPRGAVTLHASGGKGSGFVWSLSAAPSGGTISAGGVYTAGTTPSVTDVVHVVDSLGNVASASIAVGPGVSITSPPPTASPGDRVTFAASGGSGTGYAWSLPTNHSGGSITTAGVYQPGSTVGTSDTVKVVDSLGNSASASVEVTEVLKIQTTAGTVSGSVNVAPLGSLTFVAAGGSGMGYGWSLQTNASGGTISGSGAYKAGAKGSVTDIVQLTDSAGNHVTVNVAVGAQVSVSPATVTVAPGGVATFTATGGTGSFTWSVATNKSGASISAAGAYTAGMTGGTTDTVQAADANGNIATAQVTITGTTVPAAVGRGCSCSAGGSGGSEALPTGFLGLTLWLVRRRRGASSPTI
jgi:hypothetical protein